MKWIRRSIFVLFVFAGAGYSQAQVTGTVIDSPESRRAQEIDSPHPQISSKSPEHFEISKARDASLERNPIKSVSAPRKPFLLLGALVYAAAVYDMRETELGKRRWNRSVSIALQTCPRCISNGELVWFSDNDPLARPIVNLPTPAYFATGIAIATGVNFLGWKMARSQRFHKIWFVPQSISIAGNSWGGSSYR